LGLGDSTVAGVGVSNALEGLTAQFSLALHSETSRGVAWRSVGESGATTKDILERFIPAALEEPADILLISIGTNDAKDLKPLWSTISRFERLIAILREGHPEAIMLFSSLPAFHLFPVLPQPLRGILYGHAQAIERSIRPLIEARPYAFMSPPPQRYHDSFFAPDGFHPGVDGYRDWGRFALRDALERGALEHLTRR
jgi:lysophospholipase L1-like esterase